MYVMGGEDGHCLVDVVEVRREGREKVCRAGGGRARG